MPKNKRNKVVSLTKVKKKGKEWKDGVVSLVRQSLESYPYVYVFSFENLRSEAMRQVRDEHKETCRFVMGGTKLMRTALGKGPEDEQAPRVSELGEYLRGPVGLLFTRLPHDEVEALVAGCASEDFARAGSKATRTVEVPAGPVSGPDGPMAHTLEPQLRKNGMPTRLVKGVVELVSDYTVCREGAVLTSQQATLLRHFGIKMATFRLGLVAVWRKGEDGSQPEVEVLDETYLDRFRELTTEEQWEQQGFAVEVEEREE